MGLFSNNKKLCPICGEPTPRIFSTKVEDVPLCKACANKIFLPEGALDTMTLDELEQYMNYYEKNQILRDKFHPTYEFDAGTLMIRMDHVNGLFSLHSSPDALVFEKSTIETYRILEDNQPLFQGHKTAIKFFESNVPAMVRAMAPLVTQFHTQMREYERMERMERMMDRQMEMQNRQMEMQNRQNGLPPVLNQNNNGYNNNNNYNNNYNNYSSGYYRNGIYYSRPRFEGEEPFRKFSIRVRMEHPYWTGIHHGKLAAPAFNDYNPSIESYLHDYENKVKVLHELALQFKKLVNPKSKEIYDGEKGMTAGASASAPKAAKKAAPKAAGADNTVEEIKKFKELLDAGIITEEEFNMKKKQLLGI